MSSSVIGYNEKLLNIDDTLLLIALYYLKESTKNVTLPLWYRNYGIEVLGNIIQMKPIGWASLYLDEYLNEIERVNFFIKKLTHAQEYIKKQSELDVNTLNSILRMKETEGYELKNCFIKNSQIIGVLEDLISFIRDSPCPLKNKFIKKKGNGNVRNVGHVPIGTFAKIET